MLKTIDILYNDYEKLSIKIRNDFFKPINTYKTTIFLCGADISDKGKIRYKIAKALNNLWNSIYYDIIYPEDIFDELLYSSQSKDLLSLEKLLAESVDAIILIPESPGSFTELGAFANDDQLREKIVCVLDRKYKKEKNFINKGPLKIIKKSNKNGVIFIDPDNIEKEIDKITSTLKKMKKYSTKIKDKVNLLQLENYLLPTIFLLEPVLKSSLIKIVGYATEDEINSFQATTTALTMLTKKRQVELTYQGYKLTQLGISHFESLRKKSRRIKYQDEIVALDELRLEIFNLKNRRKKLKV